MNILARLGKMLGVRDVELEDALVDERRAKRQLDRRGFLLAGAAALGGVMAPKALYSFGAPAAEELWTWGTGEKIVVPRPKLTVRARVHQPFYDTLIRTSGLVGPDVRFPFDGLFENEK